MEHLGYNESLVCGGFPGLSHVLSMEGRGTWSFWEWWRRWAWPSQRLGQWGHLPDPSLLLRGRLRRRAGGDTVCSFFYGRESMEGGDKDCSVDARIGNGIFPWVKDLGSGSFHLFLSVLIPLSFFSSVLSEFSATTSTPFLINALISYNFGKGIYYTPMSSS